ncbi:MAG: hypothetical protein ACKV2T_32890 [Kofleriaceae bacterium]
MPDERDEHTYARPVAGILGEVANFEPPTLEHSPEWWEQRDREVAEQRARDFAAAEAQRAIERAGDLRESGFPEMFVSSGLGDLADTEAMRHARMFIHLPKKLLVLAGGVGTGKTTAAAWLALKGQDPRPGFVRIATLARRSLYDRKLTDWLEGLTSLVIDDVGAEFLDGKGAFRSLMDEVVDTFYSNRRTLVMTTNLRPRRKGPEDEPEFAERYGERVWSRVTQVGVWGDCGTRDLRRKESSK